MWRRWRGGREPTSEDRHEAIRFYAMYDGYLPHLTVVPLLCVGAIVCGAILLF